MAFERNRGTFAKRLVAEVIQENYRTCFSFKKSVTATASTLPRHEVRHNILQMQSPAKNDARYESSAFTASEKRFSSAARSAAPKEMDTPKTSMSPTFP